MKVFLVVEFDVVEEVEQNDFFFFVFLFLFLITY